MLLFGHLLNDNTPLNISILTSIQLIMLKRKFLNQWSVFLLVLSVLFSACSKQTVKDEYDVVIYGGTSAGVIAAYTAHKMGKSVVIINPNEHIGGLSSGGLGQTDIGNKHAVTGLSREFYRKLGKAYGRFESWTFEPSMTEKLFKDYLKEGNIPVITNKRISQVSKNQSTIESVTIVNTLDDEGAAQTIRGKVFLDCTYEGDLLPLAGVSYFVGREDNSQYNEQLSGFQLPEYHKQSGYHQFPDNVSPYKVPGDPTSGLVWGISTQEPTPTGSGDKLVQAYNFRICLTDSVENQLPITRPADYDSTKYELLARLIEAQPTMRGLNQYFIWSPMPNRKTDINNRGGFSTDMIGYSHTWAEASHEERVKIYNEHISYTKGLLYFMGHDPRVPDTLRNEVLKWGYPKDEYKQYGNFTPQIYVREGRRMVGEYVMTEANCRGEVTVDDAIGMAAYTMDSHNTQRIVVNGMVKNEGNVEVGGFPPYPISYRALTPKAAECTNLLVPVALSSTHIAFGSIRMEPVFMVLAQSAAIAASMAIDAGTTVQNVDIAALQNKIKSDPLLNGSQPDILVDNDDTTQVTITGAWDVKRGGYGRSYLIAPKNAANQLSSIRFTPAIQKAGKYRVYAYFTKIGSLSSSTDLVFFDGEKEHQKNVQPNDIVVIGQTTGEWVELGVFDLPEGKKAYAEISNKGADNDVVADAILFMPNAE
jgi:hypothetical protein